MLPKLIAALKQVEDDITPEEIADIIWLTAIRQQSITNNSTATKQSDAPPKQENKLLSNPPKNREDKGQQQTGKYRQQTSPTSNQQIGVFAKTKTPAPEKNSAINIPIKIANPPSLRNPLDLVKALKPLMRQIPSGVDLTIDEVATAQKIAEEGIFIPVTKPVLQPWLEVALVIDEGESMFLWRQTILELRRLLNHYGAFRDVRTWSLVTEVKDNNQDKDNKTQIKIRPGFGASAKNQPTRNPKELIDPNNRRLILVISDCVSHIWHQGEIFPTLKDWADNSPISIIQMLPEWLWNKTGLRNATAVYFDSLEPGQENTKLSVTYRSFLDEPNSNSKNTVIKVPILTTEHKFASIWSKMLAGYPNIGSPGFIFNLLSETQANEIVQNQNQQNQDQKPLTQEEAEKKVQRFYSNASSMAWRLISLLAASPVITLPVIRLIQETILPKSRQVHVAEVLLGRLLEPVEKINPENQPDEIEFRFISEDVRQIILKSTPTTDMMRVLSKFVADGYSLEDFIADLKIWNQGEDKEKARPFAMVTADVLRRRGGKFAQFAEELSTSWEISTALGDTPSGDKFSFGTVTVLLNQFSFKTVTVNRRGEIIKREQHQAQYFTENLPGNVSLEMVFIPGGTFMMGAPKDEKGSSNDERPQHEENVKQFFMGKYPITQGQWRAVTSLPKVDRDLKLSPSHFGKDLSPEEKDNLPVESVSWYDAVEFCARLSKASEKEYKLPSEAQWEYACRAKTTTPFYFGETITSDLANFNGDTTYADSPKGKNRRKTTKVGIFPPNAFGLYDMHGNLLEWCSDAWRNSYSSETKEGNDNRYQKSDELKNNKKNNKIRLLRGGSWRYKPEICRCAYRFSNNPDYDNNCFGFRVMCVGFRED